MSTSKNIIFFPANLIQNSLVLINYFGDLINSDKVFLEYSYQEFNSEKTVIKTHEMQKKDNKFFTIIHLDNFEKIYIRFKNNENIIDDNNGNLYISTIAPVQNETSSDVSLIPVNQNALIYPRKGLRFSYKLNKRIRLAIYKLIRKLPNFITGNYRRRINL